MLFGGGRKYSPHLFSINSHYFSLFLFRIVALCCSFHSLMNSSDGLLLSTVLLAEFIVASSSNAILKSVNKVSSDNFLQLGFMFFPVMNLTTVLIMSIWSQALATGFSALEISVTPLRMVSTSLIPCDSVLFVHSRLCMQEV